MDSPLISLEFNDAQFERLAKEFRHIHNGAPVAMALAINTSLPLVRRGVRDVVSREFNVTKTAVNRTMYLRNASSSRLTGKIGSTGYAIPLSKFGMTPKRPGRRSAAQVEIRRGRRKSFPYSFPAQMKSGHLGLYFRTPDSKTVRKYPGSGKPIKNKWGASGLPIDQKFGPAIASMLKNPGVKTQVENLSGHILGYGLDTQIERLLSGK